MHIISILYFFSIKVFIIKKLLINWNLLQKDYFKEGQNHTFPYSGIMFGSIASLFCIVRCIHGQSIPLIYVSSLVPVVLPDNIDLHELAELDSNVYKELVLHGL
jgi:hypothetical protein